MQVEMIPPEPALLKCIRCGGTGLSATAGCGADSDSDGGAELACGACGATYPVADGIPVLVRDWPAFRQEIEEARSVNPAWYETEQPAEEASPWRHHLRKRRLYVTGVIQRHLRKRGIERVDRLLDLGCGDGANLAWLAPFAQEIYGSDYNMVRLTRARHRLPQARLFLADILDYPWPDASFDLVFFNHVIEHIPDDLTALRTVQRILRPGGVVILGTPNEGAWWWQLAYRRAPDIRATTDHVHFYTADTIGRRMTEADLLVTEVSHMGWGPPDWRLDGRIRKYKFVDDAFEIAGRLLIPRQASSLFLVATRR
jgi:SAM-dependent methyltransferase